MIPFGGLSVISFDIITGAIEVVACFVRCIFAPEYAIFSMFLIVVMGGVSIQFLKLIFG